MAALSRPRVTEQDRQAGIWADEHEDLKLALIDAARALLQRHGGTAVRLPLGNGALVVLGEPDDICRLATRSPAR